MYLIDKEKNRISKLKQMTFWVKKDIKFDTYLYHFSQVLDIQDA